MRDPLNDDGLGPARGCLFALLFSPVAVLALLWAVWVVGYALTALYVLFACLYTITIGWWI